MLLGSAALFSLSLYAKAVLTAAAPFVITARCWGAGLSARRAAKVFLAACAVLVLSLLPWWIRNYSIFGEFVPLATINPAWAMQLGNNEHIVDGVLDEDAYNAKFAELHELDDELLIARALKDEAREYILADKARFLKHLALRFKLFWNIQSNSTRTDLGKILLLYNMCLAISWGIAFPMALASLWLNRHRLADFLPLFFLVGYYCAVHLVSIVSLRYRLPLEPFFVVVGSYAMARLIRAMQVRFRR